MSALANIQPAVHLPTAYRAFAACLTNRDEAYRLASGLSGIGRDVAVLGDEAAASDEAASNLADAITLAVERLTGLTADQLREVLA